MRGAATGGASTSPLTTVGDIWGYNGVDARIPVGVDGNVLTADSGAALGVSYQPVSAGSALISYGIFEVDNFSIGAAPTIVDFSSLDSDFDQSGYFSLSAGGDIEVNGAGVYLLQIAFNNFTFSASDDAQLAIVVNVVSGSVGKWSNRPGATELSGDLIYNIVSDTPSAVQGEGDKVFSAIIAWSSGSSFPAVIQTEATWYVNETETAATPDIRAAMIRLGTGDE